MPNYRKTDPGLWTGRKSDSQLYLHEKVLCLDYGKMEFSMPSHDSFALLGYACEEGVIRNQGRKGASKGPDAIRQQLAKMPYHLHDKTLLLDIGNIHCEDGNMENAQSILSKMVTSLLQQGLFPMLLGGGHDIAYGHYLGLKSYLDTKGKNQTLGIINFDAHFDLRSTVDGNTSGTPFYQIVRDCKMENNPFKYMCLGIRKDSNSKTLFPRARDLGVPYIEKKHFNLLHLNNIRYKLEQFISGVDVIYTTIDLDGFSSAYAAGVSAASPMGFSPEMVLECLEIILDSKKLISMDIAEMNPNYDQDHQTAKLAASLIHFVMHNKT